MTGSVCPSWACFFLLNESMEDGGTLICRRVLLGTFLAARNDTAEHGVLEVVADALRRVLPRRCDVAESPLDFVGSVPLVCLSTSLLPFALGMSSWAGSVVSSLWGGSEVASKLHVVF